MTAKDVFHTYSHRQWRYWMITCGGIIHHGNHKAIKWCSYDTALTRHRFHWATGEPT